MGGGCTWSAVSTELRPCVYSVHEYKFIYCILYILYIYVYIICTSVHNIILYYLVEEKKLSININIFFMHD